MGSKTLAVILAACAASAWAAGVNLLQNPGFEESSVSGGENLLLNPGFEESSCPDSSNGGTWGWYKDGAIQTPGWRGGGNAGIAKSGNATWRPTGTGAWTAFIQHYRPDNAGLNSFIEQTVRTPADGVYEFACDVARRDGYETGWIGLSVGDGQTTRECEAIPYFTKGCKRAVWRLVLKGGLDYTLRLHQFDGLEQDTAALIDNCSFVFCGAHALPKGRGTPTLHLTDLYRPHDDPDDHWDLATQFALAKVGAIDLRGVIIDYPSTAVRARSVKTAETSQPDIAAVAQMNWLTGLCVPTGVGQPDRGLPLCSGLTLLKRALEAAKEPVALHVVGSCKDVAEAGRLWPELFKAKVKGIYLNAGTAAQGGELEWNVALDPRTYAATFALPCPIYWMPCFDTVGKTGVHDTWWRFRMARAFERMRPPVKNFFNGVFGKRNPSDWLASLDEPVDQASLDKTGELLRNMWCTAGFLHAAGLTVWKDGTIAKLDEEPAKEVFRFVPVTVTCGDDGRTAWQPAETSDTRFLFEIADKEGYPEAMTRALIELMSVL